MVDSLFQQQDEMIIALKTLMAGYLPKLGLALATLIAGLVVISFVSKGIKRSLKKREIDPSLVAVLVGTLSVIAKVMLFVSVAQMVGIATTSFVAVLGAAGLAVGLALQGSLSNFAGAVLILFFKPFRSGDYIEANGKEGTVREIGIFTTKIATVDNKIVYLPNGQLANSNITNYSEEPIRRCDLVFGVGYSDDLKKAKKVLQQIINEDSRFLREPEAVVAVSELGASSVDFVFRPWVNAVDYWPARFDTIQKVKERFDQEGISIPFPQRDLHIVSGSEKL